MKISLKTKLLVSFVSGLTFAILNNLFKYFIFDHDISLARFAFDFTFFGLIFGFGYIFFLERTEKKLIKGINIPLKDDEIMLHEGAANLLKNYIWIRGKLVLSDKRLIFKSHKLNIQNGEISIDIHDISEVQPIKIPNFIQQKLRVIKKGREVLDFVVFEREKWTNHIESRISEKSQ